jgi:uncharacterized protein
MSTVPVNARRAWWLKQLHEWHWISSAICLLGLLLFSVTGITLNHSEQLDSAPRIRETLATVPVALLQQLVELGAEAEAAQSTPAVPARLRDWAQETFGVDVSRANVEWSDREVYLSMQRPGGDGWISISLRNGGAKYQLTDRGWIAWMNDLHKGRYTGQAWAWFIDFVAGACLLFAITGLAIMTLHAGRRPATWPLVGIGVLVPLLIALLWLH